MLWPTCGESGSTMNGRQRVFVVLAITLFCLSCLWVPWHVHAGSLGSVGEIHQYVYGPVWAPPVPNNAFKADMQISRLFLEWLCIAATTSGALLVSGKGEFEK